jgi:hypothetical protein
MFHRIFSNNTINKNTARSRSGERTRAVLNLRQKTSVILVRPANQNGDIDVIRKIMSELKATIFGFGQIVQDRSVKPIMPMYNQALAVAEL